MSNVVIEDTGRNPEVYEIADKLKKLELRLSRESAEAFAKVRHLLAGRQFFQARSNTFEKQKDRDKHLECEDDLILIRETWKLIEELHGGQFLFRSSTIPSSISSVVPPVHSEEF